MKTRNKTGSKEGVKLNMQVEMNPQELENDKKRKPMKRSKRYCPRLYDKRIILLLVVTSFFFLLYINEIIQIFAVSYGVYNNNVWDGCIPYFKDIYDRYTHPRLSEENAKRLHLEITRDVCSDARRIGNKWDGGYNVCFDVLDKVRIPKVKNLKNSEEKCIVYSIGISNDISFDQAITDQGCLVFAFDPTIDRETGDDFSPRIKFFDIGINDFNSGEGGKRWMKLDTIMNTLGHSHMEILKIDVEGYEWDVFRQWTKDSIIGPEICPPFQLLLGEFHFDSTSSLQSKEEVAVVSDLRAAGFQLYSRTANWKSSHLGVLAGEVKSFHCFDVSFIYAGNACNIKTDGGFTL